jgi:hypothetical protein
MRLRGVGSRENRHSKGPQLTDAFVVEQTVKGANESQRTLIHRALELAARTVGSCLLALTIVTIVFAFIGIRDAFAADHGASLIKGIEEFARMLSPRQIQTEYVQFCLVVVPPVVFAAILFMCVYRIGRGLGRLSASARWPALVFLLPACVPPLVIFFATLRAGAYWAVVWPLFMLIIPAGGALALSLAQCDVVFSPSYLATVGPEPSIRAQLLSKFIVVLFSLGLIVTIAMHAMAS